MYWDDEELESFEKRFRKDAKNGKRILTGVLIADVILAICIAIELCK